MGIRGLFEGWHIVILAIVLVVLFGAKRLPDASRAVGRSLKIFKSEIKDLKDDDDKPAVEAGSARSETVTAEPVSTPSTTGPVTPTPQPTRQTPDHVPAEEHRV